MYHHHHLSNDAFAKEGESGPSARVVYDARLGSCLVWRPVEGPPLPRPLTARLAAPPHPLPRQVKTYVAAPDREGGPPPPPPSVAPREGHSHQETELLAPAGSAPVKGAEGRAATPPRGQLLPRGRGGIDDVLKSARTAQSLFYSLQERRLMAEYRRSQRELKAELDQQRHSKRMLQLAAYQEELVNLYGPTVRDIIADTFFDDGHDPVLAVLKAKREAPLSYPCGANTLLSKGSGAPNTSRQLWERTDGAAMPSPTSAQSHRERVSREREMLLRALDERRSGRRSGY
ncbi:hypothetical protein ABB37_07655 [Leptomonas pyrrhocoris]|uniref:Uncharacterized protein n=1 Tax=Leptomonas pyrrhocoris TaxID=157538 RepID=A0A0M9FVK6_LEPPY|nr:hypothetical protein ABB37_07655 [Leptomonas pyrrhocoris]KPA76859.1 hypothetical protein ABB37_07655 [Leptomonas pyrrhocoris]|eukprot:XP_015655298.1 hypothetical protein ABB37_07655 [Leptomonas pyrrhocoris]